MSCPGDAQRRDQVAGSFPSVLPSPTPQLCASAPSATELDASSRALA